jgi:hypothetical protein
MTTHSLTLLLFTSEFLTKNNMTIFPTPIILFSASPNEEKTDNPHFDALEVIAVESQAMLNTLTEHNFQGAFKNGRSAGNGAYARKGAFTRVMVAIRPKVSFD